MEGMTWPGACGTCDGSLGRGGLLLSQLWSLEGWAWRVALPDRLSAGQIFVPFWTSLFSPEGASKGF